jgi:FkbM family methyltransferase
MKYPIIATEFDVNPSPFWDTLERGKWELDCIRKLVQVIKPTDTIIDVGAWIGVYTLLFSHLAKQVIAFEPSDDSRNILLENLERNHIKNVIVEPYAISDIKGEALLYPYNPKELDTTLGLSMSNMINRKGSGEPTLVKTITLDEYGVKPNGIKIDVEGYESKVLSRCHFNSWILLELHGRMMNCMDLINTWNFVERRIYELIDGSIDYGHIFMYDS